MNFIEKIAGDSGDIDTMEKIAAYYDSLGRQLFWGMMKEAKGKLPPGMFSGKAGLLKLLGAGGIGAGGYAMGAAKEKKKATEDDVEIANKAYRAGVQRGAQAVLARLRGMR